MFDGGFRVVQCSDASVFDGIEPAWFACAHGVPRTQSRGDQPFLLQPVERGIDGTGGDVAREARLDILENGPSIGARAQTHEAQKDGLLKRAEDLRHVYIVDTKRFVSSND